jgi:hypothetical protein
MFVNTNIADNTFLFEIMLVWSFEVPKSLLFLLNTTAVTTLPCTDNKLSDEMARHSTSF